MSIISQKNFSNLRFGQYLCHHDNISCRSIPYSNFWGCIFEKGSILLFYTHCSSNLPDDRIRHLVENSMPKIFLQFLIIIPLPINFSISLALVIILFLSGLRFSCDVLESLIGFCGTGNGINLTKVIVSYVIIVQRNCCFEESVTFLLLELWLSVLVLFIYGAVIGFGIYLYWYVSGGFVLTFTAINILMFYPYKINDFSEKPCGKWQVYKFRIDGLDCVTGEN